MPIPTRSLPRVTTAEMQTPWFVHVDRERQPYVILSNKFPMGVYIPCEFDAEGTPDWAAVCDLIRKAQGHDRE